ncbi:uncharacterized protein DEA37_0004707 [Paragonimus westermani]|uniref:Reverse transcriptase domain-containing protein n=1 Tax=Paragonimus westermani TaxID=34504 RepID=A0A5J4NL57_9TREM|nr:uncharacterized protein DEA37_0004707 [Paragonimus westermani]
MSNSLQHKVAKWFAKLLKPIRDRITQFCLKDSFGLAGLLETMNIRDKYLCSFDVESLFTNVPLDECIEFLLSYMKLHHLEVGIPASELEQLLLLCTKNVSFVFQDSAYRQIDGVAMGSPLGPILADIFVAKLEQQVTERLSSVQLYKRYVDDILLIAHNQLQAQSLIDQMNSLHPNIHFSMEGENQNSLPFLDICIRRNADGSIQRSVHRKSTWTGQYLHFESFVPRSYKQSLVRTLFDRARRICTEDTVQEEMALLETTLQLNGYPKPFIARFKQPIDIGIRPDTVSKKPVFLRLPFKGDDVCQLIHRRLVSSIARTYNAVVPVILFRTFRIPTPCVKQPVPESAKSNLIYEYRCRCGASYIGRTERQLRTRVTEHIPKARCVLSVGDASLRFHLGSPLDNGRSKRSSLRVFGDAWAQPRDQAEVGSATTSRVEKCLLARTFAHKYEMLNNHLSGESVKNVYRGALMKKLPSSSYLREADEHSKQISTAMKACCEEFAMDDILKSASEKSNELGVELLHDARLTDMEYADEMTQRERLRIQLSARSVVHHRPPRRSPIPGPSTMQSADSVELPPLLVPEATAISSTVYTSRWVMHSPLSVRMTANISSSDHSDSMYSSSRIDTESSRGDTTAILDLVKGIVVTLSTVNSRLQALETHMVRNFPPSNDPKPAVMPEAFRSPARTQEDLLAREAELAKSDVYNVVMKSLARMGGTDVADTVRRIMSSLIHHDLAITTNWTGTGNKRAACDLLLMEVVQDAISSQQKYADISAEELHVHMRRWFRNARDRAGGRMKRRTKHSKQQNVDLDTD